MTAERWNRGNFIDGAWDTAADRRIAVVSPSTGATIAELGLAGAETADRAVAAAVWAFESWGVRPGAERASYLEKMAAGLLARKEELVALICETNGKPAGEAAGDVTDAAACLSYYAGMARDLDRRQGEPVAGTASSASSTYLEPVGPVAAILPWNFPLKICAWKLGPALAAGCTVVVKPSPLSALAENAWGEVALEAGLPAGVLNIVHGDGEEVGPRLVAHPGVAKISFTGSTAVGQSLMRAAAADVKRIGLELGGKSPIIVFGDADPELAVRLVMEGVFYNAGQCCNATGRLLVERNLADRLIAMLKAKVASITIGAPDSGAAMGPVISKGQYQRILGFLDRAEHEGLTVVNGGIAAVPQGDGYFLPPTVYADVPGNSRLWQEEIFGPVLAVSTFDTEDEAVMRANDTEYGLAATIVTGDDARGTRVARRIQAGHIYLNTSVAIPPETMWGGFKKSGLGRELGPWGLAGYLEPKTLTARRT